MLASIRYTVKRYGSLAKGWKGTGYAEDIGTITFSDIFKGIPKLANGGLVSSGQLFVANESGPELVGRYGNRTGVVNNDQITESISSGVEAGVYNAMMAVLSQNSQSGGDLNITVKVGNTTLVKEVVKGYNQIKKSDPNFGFVF